MNVATDAFRGIGDSAVDSSDKAQLENEKKKIYNDKNTIETIIQGFRYTVTLADRGLAMEYAYAGLTRPIEMEPQKAWDQIEMADRHEDNELKRTRVYLDAISKWPLEKTFYAKIMNYITHNDVLDKDIDSFVELVRFWDMDNEDFFNSMILDYERSKIVRDYLDANPNIGEIDFKRYDTDTYIKVRDAKIELENFLYKQTKERKIPSLCRVTRGIKEYYDVCLYKIQQLDTSILRGIAENVTIVNYANRIHDEKVLFPGLLNDVWVNGDTKSIPELKLKSKWMLPESDSIIMYQNNALLGTAFGGEGFVLTSSRICDLKSRVQIGLNQITSVSYGSEAEPIIVSSSDKQIMISTKKQGPATSSFLYNCLNDIVKRYSDSVTSVDDTFDQVEFKSNKLFSKKALLGVCAVVLCTIGVVSIKNVVKMYKEVTVNKDDFSENVEVYSNTLTTDYSLENTLNSYSTQKDEKSHINVSDEKKYETNDVLGIVDTNTNNTQQKSWTDYTEDDLGDSYDPTLRIVTDYNVVAVAASSTLAANGYDYSAGKVHDNNLDTAWVEGIENGNGEGESIVFMFDGEYIINGFYIYNGYQKNDDIYQKNSRPQMINVWANEEYVGSFILNDLRERQCIIFDESVIASNLSIQIASVYGGNKYTDTCISEIEFDGIGFAE